MKRRALLLVLIPASLAAQAPVPLLPEATVRALAGELSGTEAKHTVQNLSLFHRMRGSKGFRAAAERLRDRARLYGLAGVEILELPADGKIFYGTQRSRPAWDADFAELWEQSKGSDGSWTDGRRIASWDTRPVTLAQDSASGEAAAALIDVGAGTAEKDYEGKDVRGQLVLISSQPEAARKLAIDRFGAAGLVSYAQNQVTGWWKEDETLIRWGHLGTFPPPATFAFMVSLQQARAWQERLARKEEVRLRASVRAGQHPGSYDIVTAVIPGTDPGVGADEIVLSCHLDHERPGANDNASGCATILEVARALQKLLREGKLAAPRRTIRFVWPPEIEGTIALLNARPDIASRAKTVIHMDMVGGDPEKTGAVFHVTRSPKSLPTFVNDVAETFGRFVNAQSDAYAGTRQAAFPLVDAEGSKRALQASFVDFTAGSDHQVWTEGSWRVPAVYFNDWPDRYIHTHADEIANIDSTKLLRAAFLGAASAWYLANLDEAQVPALLQVIRRHALERTSTTLARREQLPAEGDNLLRFHLAYEQAVVESVAAFAEVPPEARQSADAFLAGLRGLVGTSSSPALRDDSTVYRRASEPKGPMGGFGYNYFADKAAAAGIQTPALLGHQGLWGDDYAYEALNLVDGQRSVREIRDSLAAIYGPVPVGMVAEYLEALARVGVIQ